MAKTHLTKLEIGVKVFISLEQLEWLKTWDGFLNFESYPPSYKEIGLPGELGRFLIFRFFPLPIEKVLEHE